MNKKKFYHTCQSRPYLLENYEDKNLIHQYNKRKLELDLENDKMKQSLNEIR